MTDLSALTAGELIGLRLVLASLAATLGAAAAAGLRKISHLGLCLLISFAAGALLGVTLFDLLPETLETVGPVRGAVSFASGYLLFLLLTRFVFHVCPACSATHTEVEFRALTVAMVAALSVHSFMDGLAIYSGSVTSSSIGILIFLAVAYHKFPEGMALSHVARGSGMNRIKSFLITFCLEFFTTVAGGFSGFFLLMKESPRWAGYVLGHVGGGFIFLVIHALLSEVIKHHPRSTILAALGGGVSIALVGFLVGGH